MAHCSQLKTRKTSVFWRVVAGRSGAGRARGLLVIWRLWERFASWRWRADPIPGTTCGVFRVRYTSYDGEPLELPDGTRIEPGDMVGELHMDNQLLVEKVRQSRWDTFICLRQDLQALARWTRSPESPTDVKGFYGVALVGRGALRLGMVIRPRPVNLARRLERIYFSGLLLIYSYEGQERFNRGETRTSYPEEIWLSKQELLRRYDDANVVEA